MLPRRIVGLGVCLALLLVLTTVSVAGARDTLVHDGNAAVSNLFSRFAAASNSTIVRTSNTYDGFIPYQPPGELSKYGCVVLPLNGTPINKYYRQRLAAYVEAGGTLVAIGEYAGSPAYNDGAARVVMNQVSLGVTDPGDPDFGAGVGSTMSFDATTLDFFHHTTTNIAAHQITTGVTTIGYDATASITLGAGGLALARTSLLTGSRPFIAVDPIGLGRFVMVADSNVLIDTPDEYTPYDNDVLVKNLCGDNTKPTVTIVTPPNGARYKKDQPVIGDYLCSDDGDRVPPQFPIYHSEIAFCTGPVADGALIDTATGGNKSFTVNAEDLSGNAASKTHNYVVDDTPPVISMTVPSAGLDVATAGIYSRQAVVSANFSCTDDGPAPTITNSVVSGATLLNTASTVMPPAQPLQFVVNCSDSVGNTSTLTHYYYVRDDSLPVITVTNPIAGARFRKGQAVNAAYSCTDADGAADIKPGSLLGTVAVGALIPTAIAGDNLFKVNCKDLADNAAVEVNVPYVVDESPPTINIRVPAAAGKYNKGVQIVADYDCTDPDTTLTFNDILTCNGPVVDAASVDSSIVGPKTFKVDATDVAGNPATKTVSYTILGTSPPAVVISSPANNAAFKIGAAIPFSFACSDPDGPADIKSCTRVGGSGTLDSTKAGKFEVSARVEDFTDNVKTTTHSYTVSANPPAEGKAPTTGKAPVAAKVCKSRRSFTIRVKKKRGVKIVSATVFVNGKKQKTKKGKRITSRVTLIGLKKGRYNVVIRVKLSDGRTATDRRRFKTCTPKGK